MLDDPRLAVVGDQIIIFIIPRQKPRTHLVYFSIPAEMHFFIHIPLKILKLYFHVLRDRIVNDVDIIIDVFIDRLIPVCHNYLSV